jgi:cytochrome c
MAPDRPIAPFERQPVLSATRSDSDMTTHPSVLLSAAAFAGFAAPLPADPPAAPATPGLAAPNAVEGEAVFKRRCANCHATEPGKSSPLGPDLAGVVGRGAATAEFRYSEALKASGLSWTRENLDAYLAAPQKLVPGTRMVVGIPDVTQRAAVIDYLASISPTPVPTTQVPDPNAGEHDHPSGQ